MILATAIYFIFFASPQVSTTLFDRCEVSLVYERYDFTKDTQPGPKLPELGGFEYMDFDDSVIRKIEERFSNDLEYLARHRAGRHKCNEEPHADIGLGKP